MSYIKPPPEGGVKLTKMKAIFKYLLQGEHPILLLPPGSEILSVVAKPSDCGVDCVYLYAMIPKYADIEQRHSYHFSIYMTGQYVAEPNGQFLKTVVLDKGNIVLHIFLNKIEK